MKKIITFVLFVFIALISVNAKTIYVSTSGNDGNDGLSWGKAKAGLQAAMAVAASGDEIWMKGGNYTIPEMEMGGSKAGIFMTPGVSVYASFAGTETNKADRVRVNAATEPWTFANPTTLTGANGSLRLFDRLDKATPWTVESYYDGLTISFVTTNRVMYLKEKVTLQNCSFIGCSSGSTIVYFENGGSVKDCLFDKNVKGDILSLRWTAVLGGDANVIENCMFTNNGSLPLSVYNTGETLEYSKTVSIKDCTFKGNDIAFPATYVPTAYSSAALSVNNAHKTRNVDVLNCLFENNTYRNNGTSAVFFTGGGALNFIGNTLRNNTHDADAQVTGITGTLILYKAPMEIGQVRIANNLIVNNSNKDGLVYANSTYFFNNTIANNIGSSYFPSGSVAFNNIYANNVVKNEAQELVDKAIKLDSESFSFYQFNANTSPVDLMEDFIMDNIHLTSGAGFVAPTIFNGASVEHASAIAQANFSLSGTSLAKNAGDAEEIFILVDILEDWMTPYFSTDIAGNVRLVDNRINIGAYQGAKTAGNAVVEKEQNYQVYANGSDIIIDSKSSITAAIYTINGLLVSSLQIESGSNTIPMAQKGFFIVRIGNDASFKVSVR